jgi:hypothetical protein
MRRVPRPFVFLDLDYALALPNPAKIARQDMDQLVNILLGVRLMSHTPIISLKGDVLPILRANLSSSTMFCKSGARRGV